MKARNVVLFVCFAITIISAQAQGPLAPSGAPAATMKTLDQVEARIPITQIPYTCEVAGASYYLTGDMTGIAGSHGILISASDVTLDLNGFTLYGDSGSGSAGISGAPDADNLRIFNGSVRDWGATFYGVDCAGEYVAVSGVRAFNNGGGIMLSDNSSAVDCVAANNSSAGIILRHNGRVENCVAVSNGWHGIYGWKSNVVRNCKASQNSSSGIELQGGGQMTDNTSLNNGTGLRITLSGTYVAGNIVKGNGVNYDFADGNQLNILLSEIPQTISWPANVLLAGPLSLSNTAAVDAISVEASGVTIDLGGHVLKGRGTAGSTGVQTSSGTEGCAVRNGTISDFGFAGIDFFRGVAAHAEGVAAVSNGYYGIALRVAKGSIVENVRAQGNGSAGIHLSETDGCIIRNCTAVDNVERGIKFDSTVGGKGNLIDQCTVTGNGRDGIFFYTSSGRWLNNVIRGCTIATNAESGVRIYLTGGGRANGNSIQDCIISGNGSDGVSFQASNTSARISGITIKNCSIEMNAGAGILFANTGGYYFGSVIEGCTLLDNSDTGIAAYNCLRSRIDGNSIVTSYGLAPTVYAILTDNATCQDNLIVRNSAAGYVTGYNVSASDTCGPVVSTVGALGTSGADMSPWANFER